MSKQMVIGGLIITALVSLGQGYFLARTLSRAAKQMVQAAQQIAQTDLRQVAAVTRAMAAGDLTHSLTIQTSPLTYQAGDEIGDLACAFNQMIGSLHDTGRAFEQMLGMLRRLIGEVAENAGKVNTAAGQLSIVASQAGEATGQIATTIHQVAKSASQQSEIGDQIATSMGQMGQVIEQVATGAQEQAGAVVKSSALTAEMVAMMQQVNLQAQTGAKGSIEATQMARAGAKTVEATIKGMEAIKAKVDLSIFNISWATLALKLAE